MRLVVPVANLSQALLPPPLKSSRLDALPLALGLWPCLRNPASVSPPLPLCPFREKSIGEDANSVASFEAHQCEGKHGRRGDLEMRWKGECKPHLHHGLPQDPEQLIQHLLTLVYAAGGWR